MWEWDHKEGWVQNWCFWTVVLKKILESPWDCKEIQPVHPKGNQSWLIIGKTDAKAETTVLWPPDTKNWLIRTDPDAAKDWGQEEKGTTEDEMVGWHHQLNSVQFSCPVVFDSFRLHRLQYARPPCLSPTPGVYSNSRPCHGQSLSKLQELVMEREAWHAAVHMTWKSWTWLCDWTELIRQTRTNDIPASVWLPWEPRY